MTESLLFTRSRGGNAARTDILIVRCQIIHVHSLYLQIIQREFADDMVPVHINWSLKHILRCDHLENSASICALQQHLELLGFFFVLFYADNTGSTISMATHWKFLLDFAN